jgi:phosphatidylserine/phosphatidylglycerophosphate/cardiolipin synthase-like enzyme
MRKRRVYAGVTVNAIAGTHVVTLGLDISASARPGCLGFAILREDHTEEERYWMRGSKTFPSTNPGLAPGGSISSRLHPFQTFQWADYSAKPGHEYTYTVVPLYGSPKQLREGKRVSVRVTTEIETGPTHSIFFNRGAIASQEYARVFQNKPPNAFPNGAAYRWLSRGLLEALLGFIGRATDASFGLHGAIYEFQWTAVLKGLAEAAARGVSVEVIYDGITGGPVTLNKKAIEAADIVALCQPRTEGTLMHNKFFVLSRNGAPVAVWTGSTNLTENGIFGHSNLGHLVEDAAVAQVYMDYWQQLKRNEKTARMKQWTATNNPAPPNPWDKATSVVFSPHTGLGVLDWYATIAQTKFAPALAQKPLMMTFAFGMHKSFQSIYSQTDGILRFALMESPGTTAAAAKQIRKIRGLPNVVVAIGNNIPLNGFDTWLEEREQLPDFAHVRYVHTKYMLVDPLGRNPIVISGSANFSEASTHTNDENMLVIRDDLRVADIYVGEFMRMYSHYAFREAVGRAVAAGEDPEKWQPSALIEDDTWQKDYFTANSQRLLRRQYFAHT